MLFFHPEQNLPAAKGLGYLRRVPHGQAEAFAEAAREDDADGFELHPLPAAASKPSPDPSPDHLVVAYVEPREANPGVRGLDIGGDADRRATADRAAATGEMALTAPLTLAHTRDRGPGLLAMVPVRTRSADPLARHETGWVYATLLPQELLAGLGGSGRAEVSAEVYADDAEGRPVCLASTGESAAAGGDADDPLALRSGFTVGGREWTLTTRPTAAFERASLLGAWLVKAAGLLSAALTLALFRVPAIEQRRGRQEARRLAQAMTRELREAAETDALTGLLNRAALLKEIQTAMGGTGNDHGPRVAVLFLDFDRFKEVNDTRGHAAGDELLRRISGRILAELRSGDLAGRTRRRTAGGSADRRSGKATTPTVRGERAERTPLGTAVPARLGGDEFVVLLRDLDGPDDARRVAERLLRRLSKPYFLSSGGGPVVSTPSIGIAVASDELTNAAGLVAAADAAMYAAKRAGRACIRVHGVDATAPKLQLAV